MDEAGRSAKPPLMTASAAEDIDSDAAAHLDADGTDEVNDFGDAPATADAAEDGATDYGLGDAHAADDNDADGSFSWNSSSWDSAKDSAASGENGSGYSAPAHSASRDSAFQDSAFQDDAFQDSAFQSSSDTTRADVPFPADTIGRTRPDVGTFGSAAGREATRADDTLSPGPDSPGSGDAGRGGPTATDRLGAAAAGLGSKLDLNGKLDWGRQAWRQAMTGPNNWLSSKSASSSSPDSPATSRSVFSPARDSGSAAGYGTEHVSGTDSYGGSASYGAPAGYSDSLSSTASYSGSVPSTASYGGPAAGASAGSSPAGSASPASSSSSAFSAGSAAAGSGAAYAGSRPGAGTSGPSSSSSSTSSWRGRGASVSAKSKRKNSRRQAQLTLSRIEPWSVMKFSFVVSVVAFIVLFVAVAVLYMVVSSLGVFTSLQSTVETLTGSKGTAGTNVASWFSASRILGYTGMLGALNIVLITAISTIGAVVYNLIVQTIGGIEVTLRETE